LRHPCHRLACAIAVNDLRINSQIIITAPNLKFNISRQVRLVYLFCKQMHVDRNLDARPIVLGDREPIIRIQFVLAHDVVS